MSKFLDKSTSFLILALLIAGAMSVFVWPTPYRDIPIRSSLPWVFAARQHRMTGRVEWLTRSGWQSAAGPFVPHDTTAMQRLREMSR